MISFSILTKQIVQRGSYQLQTAFLPVIVQCRHGTGKHWDPKWKKYRAAKVLKVDLPDFDKIRREANMSPMEMRAKLKKDKMMPPRTFQDREVVIASTNTIFEPFVPSEGDGVASIVSSKGAQQRVVELGYKGKSLNEARKIRKLDEDFNTKEFPEMAQEIYLEAHKLLQSYKDNEDRLHELVTEKAYPEMIWKLDKKTLRWNFVESVEAPRVVHVRTTEMLNKENVYAQVTVRFHSKQTLALYDRFGRLLYGNEKIAKSCLEYVVFEKHLADEYGHWRIHGKVIPDWMPQTNVLVRTLKQPKLERLSKDEKSVEITAKQGVNDGGQNVAMAT